MTIFGSYLTAGPVDMIDRKLKDEPIELSRINRIGLEGHHEITQCPLDPISKYKREEGK